MKSSCKEDSILDAVVLMVGKAPLGCGRIGEKEGKAVLVDVGLFRRLIFGDFCGLLWEGALVCNPDHRQRRGLLILESILAFIEHTPTIGLHSD